MKQFVFKLKEFSVIALASNKKKNIFCVKEYSIPYILRLTCLYYNILLRMNCNTNK